MFFDCPDTGEPLSSTTISQWPGADDERVAMHCPKCSKLHTFERSQASEPAEEAVPA